MCRDCILELYENLSPEAKAILEVLPATKAEAMAKTGISYTITNRAFVELEACKLVRYVEKGRSKYYDLTDLMREIKKTPKKESSQEPIVWKNFGHK